jgi:hypothetical protein
MVEKWDNIPHESRTSTKERFLTSTGPSAIFHAHHAKNNHALRLQLV